MVAEFLEHILVLIIDHMIPLLELMGVFIVAIGALSRDTGAGAGI